MTKPSQDGIDSVCRKSLLYLSPWPHLDIYSLKTAPCRDCSLLRLAKSAPSQLHMHSPPLLVYLHVRPTSLLPCAKALLPVNSI